MKFVFVSLFSLSVFAAAAQAIPEGTTVPMICKVQIDAKQHKQGAPAPFEVAEDVKVDGKVVIPAGAKVHAVVTKSVNSGGPHKGEGDLRVDFYDVMAMDGSTVKLTDCFIFTNGANNLNKHLPMFAAGTRKNCRTAK